METKKNPSVDLTKRSTYYFSIGLFISTALAVMAFEWKQREAFIVIDANRDNFIDPLIDVPVTSITPPAPIPVKINPVFKVVDDTEPADSIPIILPQEDDPINIISITAPEPEKETDIIMTFPEETASPKGGFDTFYKYVGDNVKYPAQARRVGIEGRVYVEFVINKDGSFTEVRAIKGIGGGCDEEAVRIVQGAPNWN
ncbi:MAG TPA: TonB family protein, partial [Cyclobacteriaceae bacterium]|nr:TonB family protein [Cyclobacteriaceae bacterium]